MSFRELELKYAYSSDRDNTIKDFYIPLLSESIEYCRISGFFSSTSLAVSAIGIINLIKNGGRMRLITSPKLTKEDLELIQKSQDKAFAQIEENMLKEIDEVEDEFIKNHLFAIGWMLANEKLEIKIAIPQNYTDHSTGGIFHQKIGIFKDENDDRVSFSGSINESFSAWSGKNTEEFKVYKSWEPLQFNYMEPDLKKFEDYWNDFAAPRVKVFNLFEALKTHLIEIAPKDITDLKLEKYYNTKNNIKLYNYQNQAISNWIKNGCQGIFEMATGTGKTFTAIGCINELFKKQKKLLVVITCPYNHLITQWKKEINHFGLRYDELIIADSTNTKWPEQFSNICYDTVLEPTKHSIILTTHTTFSSKKFKEIVCLFDEQSLQRLVIADEAHGIGSEKRLTGLIDEYKYRLALSATPNRIFDPEGTKSIFDYFGDVVYEFPLSDAISKINPKTGMTYLTPFRYHPIFIDLTGEELEQYIIETKKIAIFSSKSKDENKYQKNLEKVLRIRSNIIKNAENKYQQLLNILSDFEGPISNIIVYCSENDREQIERVSRILNNFDINFHRLTMREGIHPSDEFGGLSKREYIIQKFAEGEYNVLLAQKCLDEGVDVPPARTAFLIASSSNPRQYIQRIGRVIRHYKGKSVADIYDFIVSPSLEYSSPEIQKIEQKIFEKELERAIYIANHAINGPTCTIELHKIKRSYF